MSVINRSAAQSAAAVIRDETTEGANTASRVGGLLRDLADSVTFEATLSSIAMSGNVTGTIGSNTVVAIRGVPVADFSPQNNEILVYDETENRWQPSALIPSIIEPSLSNGQVLTTVAGVTAWAAPAGVTDHGALSGLSDDDHPQYVLVTGSRDMAGALRFGVAVSAPSVSQSPNTDAEAEGATLTIAAQDCSGNTDAVGGLLVLRGGIASGAGGSHEGGGVEIFGGEASGASGTRVGGSISLTPGTGATENGAIYLNGETSVGGNKIVDVATPTGGTDAANKEYVDTARYLAFVTLTDDDVLELSYAFKHIICNKSSDLDIEVPPASDVAFTAGTQIAFEQAGEGQVTFTAGDGVTIHYPPSRDARTNEERSVALLTYKGSDVWLLSGDLAAAP